MGKHLLRTHAIIDSCEQHLADSGSNGTEIESYLTQHALVVLCADIQNEVLEIIDERVAKCEDVRIQSYVSASSRVILRSVQKDELAGYVKRYGSDIKDQFNDLLDDADVSRYNNAVHGRHGVAHGAGAQITFGELKEAVISAEKILDALKTAINEKYP